MFLFAITLVIIINTNTIITAESHSLLRILFCHNLPHDMQAYFFLLSFTCMYDEVVIFLSCFCSEKIYIQYVSPMVAPGSLVLSRLDRSRCEEPLEKVHFYLQFHARGTGKGISLGVLRHIWISYFSLLSLFLYLAVCLAGCLALLPYVCGSLIFSLSRLSSRSFSDSLSYPPLVRSLSLCDSVPH